MPSEISAAGPAAVRDEWGGGAGLVTLRVVFRTLVIVAAIVGAEQVARLAYRTAHSSGNAGDFIGRRGGGPAIVVNHLGFREREIPPKQAGRYRIAVVGDSIAWGQGIEAPERFSNRLEEFLGARYEVFNFGLPGAHDHMSQLAQALSTSPDFVVLQLYITAFETPEMERPQPYPLLPESLHRRLEPSSMLYDLLGIQWAQLQQELGVVESYEQYLARNLRDPDSPSSRAAFGPLREFILRSRRTGVPSGIVFFPATDAMGANGSGYPFGYLHERVRTLCAEQQIPCLDLLPAFSKIKDPRTLWVSPFDAHPNADANRRVAYEMLARFAPVWHR
jgi:lysophospholipase L1-like esterase